MEKMGKNVIALCAMNSGTSIPPLSIFLRKRMSVPLMNGAPNGSIGCMDDMGTGYIDGGYIPVMAGIFCGSC